MRFLFHAMIEIKLIFVKQAEHSNKYWTNIETIFEIVRMCVNNVKMLTRYFIEIGTTKRYLFLSILGGNLNFIYDYNGYNLSLYICYRFINNTLEFVYSITGSFKKLQYWEDKNNQR